MGASLPSRIGIAVVVLGVTVACVGCNSTSTPNASAAQSGSATPLSLSWSAGSQSGTDVATASPGMPGSVTITPSGTPPFQGKIFGNCGVLSQATTSASFLVTVSSGICVLSVQDAAGRIRGIVIGGSPPRAFLSVMPTGLTDQTGTVRLALGAIVNLTINEALVGSSFNAPYSTAVQGMCVAASSAIGPPGGSASVSISGVASGQCVVVFSDAGGQATMLNFTVV